ncbi:GGDEF domain-containing protein [Cryobacterium sp. PAMC25264]|uniref:GGDEF domain-containing protein n=1 Tax=Cryobacterium sp. PAMC25264 TaxID=2861288 RepID=UPI001C629767|nr:GGDEF domain-containing protein [Cryobacterium sp. PAMC25264]QYF73712.1 GGDEF domain-containing protein [Cryobacterium sp. PAMC25264]
MELDGPTLQMISGLMVILCGVSFIFNTALNRNDPPGRLWSLAFVAGIMVAVGYGAYLVSDTAWWAIALANTALVISIGALWSGTRVYNGRSSAFLIVGGVALLVGVVTMVPGEAGGEWAGAGLLWVCVAVLGVFGGAEAMRGRLRRNVNGRILAIVLFLAAVFYAGRAIAFQIDGAESATFITYFGSGTTSIFNMALIVTACIAVSILRAERVGSNAVGDIAVGIHSAAGVLSGPAFRQAAADHLQRAEMSERGLAVIGADIDNLPEINTAFGRTAGDEAISRFADTLRGSAPMMAQIGHLAAGRFFILAGVSSATEARAITERVQNALVDGPLGESYQIRLTASFGIADTFDHGYDLGELSEAVNRAIDIVKRGGGNDIAVAVDAAPAPRDL